VAGQLTTRAGKGSPLTNTEVDNNFSNLLNPLVNAQTGTTYTLVADDNGKLVTLSNAAAIAVTIPLTLPVGFRCVLQQIGAGAVTITATTADTLNGTTAGSVVSTKWLAANLTQDVEGSWRLSGVDAKTWDGSTKTVSTSAASGGVDGDIHLKYTA